MEKHPDAILLSAHAPEDVSALRDTIIAFFEAAMVEDVLKLALPSSPSEERKHAEQREQVLEAPVA